MTKRKVTKLFAVVALTASAPAVAENPRPVAKHAETAAVAHRAQPDPWATPPTTTTLPAQPAVSSLAQSLFVLFGIAAKPRELPTGAPAPGNVARRTSSGMRTTVPRELPTGAPACGNVGSKAPRPPGCK